MTVVAALAALFGFVAGLAVAAALAAFVLHKANGVTVSFSESHPASPRSGVDVVAVGTGVIEVALRCIVRRAAKDPSVLQCLCEAPSLSSCPPDVDVDAVLRGDEVVAVDELPLRDQASLVLLLSRRMPPLLDGPARAKLRAVLQDRDEDASRDGPGPADAAAGLRVAALLRDLPLPQRRVAAMALQVVHLAAVAVRDRSATPASAQPPVKGASALGLDTPAELMCMLLPDAGSSADALRTAAGLAALASSVLRHAALSPRECHALYAAVSRDSRAAAGQCALADADADASAARRGRDGGPGLASAAPAAAPALGAPGRLGDPAAEALSLIASRWFAEYGGSAQTLQRWRRLLLHALNQPSPSRPSYVGEATVEAMAEGGGAPALSAIRPLPTRRPGELCVSADLDYAGGAGFRVRAPLSFRPLGRSVRLSLSLDVRVARLRGRVVLFLPRPHADRGFGWIAFVRPPAVELTLSSRVAAVRNLARLHAFVEAGVRSLLAGRATLPSWQRVTLPWARRTDGERAATGFGVDPGSSAAARAVFATAFPDAGWAAPEQQPDSAGDGEAAGDVPGQGTRAGECGTGRADRVGGGGDGGHDEDRGGRGGRDCAAAETREPPHAAGANGEETGGESGHGRGREKSPGGGTGGGRAVRRAVATDAIHGDDLRVADTGATGRKRDPVRGGEPTQEVVRQLRRRRTSSAGDVSESGLVSVTAVSTVAGADGGAGGEGSERKVDSKDTVETDGGRPKRASLRHGWRSIMSRGGNAVAVEAGDPQCMRGVEREATGPGSVVSAASTTTDSMGADSAPPATGPTSAVHSGSSVANIVDGVGADFGQLGADVSVPRAHRRGGSRAVSSSDAPPRLWARMRRRSGASMHREPRSREEAADSVGRATQRHPLLSGRR